MGVVHGVQAAWPRMVAQGFGHVVNTASMAAFLPTPWRPLRRDEERDRGLSRALRVEGAALGVRVSVLCPGVVRTPILERRAARARPRLPPPELQKALWERTRPMDADAFARKSLDDVARNRAVIIHPARRRVLRFLNRITPSLIDTLSRLALARFQARRGK